MQIQKTREQDQRQVNSGRTAISRIRLSAPAKYLFEKERLVGRILDFGCGRGDLSRFLDGDIEQWDPNWHPDLPTGTFDTVTCIYVLNVLREKERDAALNHTKSFVRRGGRLYVAVRRDIDSDGPCQGCTEQYRVSLELPSLVRKTRFEIYEWVKR